MSEDKDVRQENAQLKIQVKNLEGKITSMLDMSHNLRSSITSTSAYAKLLLKRTDELDPELLADALSRIENHSAESVRLVGEIQSRGFE